MEKIKEKRIKYSFKDYINGKKIIMTLFFWKGGIGTLKVCCLGSM